MSAIRRATSGEKEFKILKNLVTQSGYPAPAVLMVPKSEDNVLLASADPRDKLLIRSNSSATRPTWPSS
ncbi:MAG: hypothetical protein WC132_06595 [Methanomethylophilus sp.]